MAHSVDLERQVQERHQRGGHHGQRTTGTDEEPGGARSSSSATCNPGRGVAAMLDEPGRVCRNLGSLMPSCFTRGSSGPAPLPPPARVYHIWPGKNVFFLDGRVIWGPYPQGIIMTGVAVILSEWIFLVADGPSTHPTLILASSLILAATVTVTLLLTAMRDPGIIPRNNHHQQQQVSPLEEAGTSTAGRSSTPSRFAIVNGVETRLRFCRVCKIFRPPRSSHCAVCDNCVDRFDHHCTWISQCIGLRNYRLYLLLVSSALAFYTFVFPFAVRRISAKMDSNNVGVFVGLAYLPKTYALAALSFLAICYSTYLLAYNAFLVAKNQTSHERRKGRLHNPYDEGTLLGNIKECLIEKLPPPRVDFRAVVAEPNNQGSTATNENDDPSPPGGACRLPTREGCC